MSLDGFRLFQVHTVDACKARPYHFDPALWGATSLNPTLSGRDMRYTAAQALQNKSFVRQKDMRVGLLT
jgi:hypothetical protein